MAENDDEIDRALRKLDALRDARRLRAGRKGLFTTELQAEMDRESAQQSFWGMNVSHRWKASCRWGGRVGFRILNGYPQPPMDEDAKMHLDIFRADGRISKSEWLQAVWQRVARRAEDGGLVSVGPTRRAVFIAKLAVVLTIFGSSAFIVEVLAEPFSFISATPRFLVFGYILGITGKGIYACAWGHEALARKLRYLSPFFRK